MDDVCAYTVDRIYRPLVLFKRIHENAKIPTKATPGSAGWDLYCVEDFVVYPQDWCMASTGLQVELPDGFEMQIRPRSGLAARYGLLIPNSPGTVDSDYRGEIRVLLQNPTNTAREFKAGDRIAQAVFQRIPDVGIMEVGEMSETDRGHHGFGSTGE